MGKIKDLTVDSHDVADAIRDAFNFGNRYSRSDRSGPGPYTLKPGEEKLKYDEGAILCIKHYDEEQFVQIGNEYMYSGSHKTIQYRAWSFKTQCWEWICLNDEDIVSSTDVRLATPDEANLVKNLFEPRPEAKGVITLNDSSGFMDGMEVTVTGLNGVIEATVKLEGSSVEFIPIDIKIT
jgi:hypothetical protein